MASPSDTMMVQLNWKWEQPPGHFAPNATETTGKEGEYISGWSDGSRLPGGTGLLLYSWGKGMLYRTQGGSLGQFLVLPLPVVKMSEN